MEEGTEAGIQQEREEETDQGHLSELHCCACCMQKFIVWYARKIQVHIDATGRNPRISRLPGGAVKGVCGQSVGHVKQSHTDE